MANNNYTYEYINEESINCELICNICYKPFAEPISTPCNHKFCHHCIKQWIDMKKTSCPICRCQIKSINQCIQVSPHLQNLLDQLPIKCFVCGDLKLKRIDFNDHINKACPKINVLCSAADIKCPWIGTREELEKHISTCKFAPLRSILAQMISENEQLNIKYEQLNIQNEQLYIQKQQLYIKKQQLYIQKQQRGLIKEQIMKNN
ncbi:unnamed protein product [Rotaria sp. Silwood1]|nr:unnamed protein product [Rotaria sp. Silwood1]CAF5014837.1 unnamed protein product [Rotaria sp. Silwood1]